MSILFVFREYQGEYQRIGRLEGGLGSTTFAYEEAYLNTKGACSISANLPLRERAFDERQTAAFFSGLIPEGSMRHDIETAARAERGDYLKVLEALRNEPVGALLFSDQPGITGLRRAYEPIAGDVLSDFARNAGSVGLDLTLESRISLAGAQLKIGLYHTDGSAYTGWYVPRGAAPSTHIVKACATAYPDETVCEALCMRAAALMDLEPAACFLIDVGAAEPLIAVERYDRFLPDDGEGLTVDDMPVPMRLHQEDMCQALGISSGLKYEPSQANYLNLMADALRRESSVFGEDRLMFGYYQLFDYLVGNCDNHLKNWSMLWDADWSFKHLAPLYDVVDTTLYPNLLHEMGVSFGGTRVIDDAKCDDVLQRLISCGIDRQIAGYMISDMSNEVVPALERATNQLVEEGFLAAERVLERMLPGVRKRIERIAG